jgi:hypothetical protein
MDIFKYTYIHIYNINQAYSSLSIDGGSAFMDDFVAWLVIGRWNTEVPQSTHKACIGSMWRSQH